MLFVWSLTVADVDLKQMSSSSLKRNFGRIIIY